MPHQLTCLSTIWRDTVPSPSASSCPASAGFHPEDESNMLLWNISKFSPTETTKHHREIVSSSTLWGPQISHILKLSSSFVMCLSNSDKFPVGSTLWAKPAFTHSFSNAHNLATFMLAITPSHINIKLYMPTPTVLALQRVTIVIPPPAKSCNVSNKCQFRTMQRPLLSASG